MIARQKSVQGLAEKTAQANGWWKRYDKHIQAAVGAELHESKLHMKRQPRIDAPSAPTASHDDANWTLDRFSGHSRSWAKSLDESH